MLGSNEILWTPLLEAAAQTITGAIGSLMVGKAISRINKSNSFTGVMDLWKRGIHITKLEQGSRVSIDCLISPFAQLFPSDPYNNAKKWNSLYSFDGKISKEEYQTLEFFAGSDAALRINSLNGDTLVGLYDRYGFIGDGLVGVVPTKLIHKILPDFFNPKFIGSRVVVSGRLSRCPSQHGFVAQSIGLKAGLNVNIDSYKDLWFLNIDKIKTFNSASDRVFSLLGSPWAVTNSEEQQYIVQYGYLSNEKEFEDCSRSIINSDNWKYAQVYYDDIVNPDKSRSFKNNYLI